MSTWDEFEIESASAPSKPKRALKAPDEDAVNEFDTLIAKCLDEIKKARTDGSYDSDDADKMALFILEVLMQLRNMCLAVENEARHSKYEIERIEAEKHEFLRKNSTGKVTESALSYAIARDPDVVSAKERHAEADARSKQFNYVVNILNNGHILFRNLGKSKI